VHGKLARHESTLDLKWNFLYAQGIAGSKEVSDVTQPDKGWKVDPGRREYNVVKDPVRRNEGPYGKYQNRGHGPHHVPP
jgi:hypothetical protein